MNDIYTFYKLIAEYKIEIPVIQRSYAEGRNTKHAEDVRKSIVESIIKSVSTGTPLFFDFVYGNILSEKKFIPFDGQQRLTTLFLFHRYIFEKANDSDSKKMLKRFTYATRPSAKEFIEKLCENTVIPSNDKTLSEFLTNQNWFFDDWKKDPTISGILTVLDEIHAQFSKKSDVDFAEIAKRLKETELISFHFVNMKENNLPNQTYVKMNARGKSLTGFENFKASLEEYLDKSDKSLCETMKQNVDGKWLDLFFAKSKPKLPDEMFMSLFNRHFINIWNLCKKQKPDLEEKYSYEKVDSDLAAFPSADTFISWSVYETVLKTAPLEKTVTPIFNFLTVAVSGNPVESEIKPYKKWDLYGGEKDNTYPSRVRFFALLSYFENGKYDSKSFSNWMRTACNIIENQTIDSQESYLYALRLFSELAEHSHSIYDFLANHSNKIKSEFAKNQVEEECLKAKKILESNSWEKIILEAERYGILLGKINVLFQNGEKTTEQEFTERFNLLKSIRENKKDSYHIIKILLSYYEKSQPQGKLFLGNTEENIKQLVTKTFSGEFRKIKEDKINPSIRNEWIKELATSNLLNISRGKYVTNYGSHVVLWGTEGCRWKVFGNNVWGNVILGEFRRNILLKSLNLPHSDFDTDYDEDNLFFSGWETNFKFENHYFQWWTHDSKTECDVYLMENDWANYKKRQKPLKNKTNTEADSYFAFNASDEMLKNTDLFADALRKLIAESEK